MKSHLPPAESRVKNNVSKTIKTIVLLICIILGTNSAFSQRGHGHGGHRGPKVVKRGGRIHGRVVVRSAYRPAKIVVYHPHWRPNYGYHRRWVYFPRYNFYWDNWRQGYYFMNGPVWVFNATPPPVIVNVNLENERNYELKEDEDDVDDVYKTNDGHKTEYKSE